MIFMKQTTILGLKECEMQHFNNEQLEKLSAFYEKNKYYTIEQKNELVEEMSRLGKSVKPRQISRWFRNRRYREYALKGLYDVNLN